MSVTEFYRRRDDMAVELETRLESGDLVIENGWLVEVENKHTCGTGENGHYGLHEPGCGRVPVFDIAAAMIRDQDEALAADGRAWGVPEQGENRKEQCHG